MDTQPFSRFLDHLRLDQGASPHTLDAYGRDLKQLSDWLQTQGITRLQDITSEHLSQFIKNLSQNQMLRASSQSRKLSALRRFFKFACLELGLEQNPSDLLEQPKKSKTLPKPLSPAEIDALLVTAARGLPYAHALTAEALRARDRALVLLLYATGARISEALGLEVMDVDLAGETIRVRGKRGKVRIAPFTGAATETLTAYLAGPRGELALTSDGPLFVGERGTPLTRQAAWHLLSQLALAAGIESPVSPHRLRHSFATHLLDSGLGLRSLQLLLGHSDLSTTQVYTQVTPERLAETIRKFHPRGGG